MLLAGDIGGTKTHLAIIDPAVGPRAPQAEAIYPSADYADLTTIAHDFLARHPSPITGASFGVAGPVVDGRATITNLSWAVDAIAVAAELGVERLRLLNDLEAIGHAVPHLAGDDLQSVLPGTARPGGAIAIVAPGTGLGEGFLTWDGVAYRPHPSEGGHTDFAPTTRLEMDLLAYLLDRHEHVSYERVISGRGLPNIYAFLRDTGRADEPAWLVERLAAAPDPTPAIVDAALDPTRPCDLCAATVDLFAAVLGAKAGNLALTVLATGGVFLGGGIPPRLVPLLRGASFRRSFLNKGRLGSLLNDVPVSVIATPIAGLLGAAYAGLAAALPD